MSRYRHTTLEEVAGGARRSGRLQRSRSHRRSTRSAARYDEAARECPAKHGAAFSACSLRRRHSKLRSSFRPPTTWPRVSGRVGLRMAQTTRPCALNIGGTRRRSAATRTSARCHDGYPSTSEASRGDFAFCVKSSRMAYLGEEGGRRRGQPRHREGLLLVPLYRSLPPLFAFARRSPVSHLSRSRELFI